MKKRGVKPFPIGSTRVTDLGYRLIKTERSWEREHRFVWREAFGEIPDNYDIHHKDGNKLNNLIDNLEMISHLEHSIYHSSGRPAWNKGIKGKASHMSKMFMCVECGHINNAGNLAKHFKLSSHLIKQEF